MSRSPGNDVDSAAIRMATGGDKTAIIAVTNAAFAVETFLTGGRTDEERLTEMMKRGIFLLAQDWSGKLLASVYVELRGRRGYLGMLAVAPRYQGIGLGRKMVQAAENYCRSLGCDALELSILSLRPELPPFYRKLGYVETGTEEFRPSRPLQNGVECHCILMSKAL
jgi:GNAT superfamily N-acetyltransferase